MNVYFAFQYFQTILFYSRDNTFMIIVLFHPKLSFLYLGRPTTIVDTMKKAEMWFIRSYWDLEFPHPTLPNIEFVGGLHCKPAKPLPEVNKSF